jgi:hypothetical protein
LLAEFDALAWGVGSVVVAGGLFEALLVAEQLSLAGEQAVEVGQVVGLSPHLKYITPRPSPPQRNPPLLPSSPPYNRKHSKIIC